MSDSNRKELTGVVISNRMDKTVVINVERRFPHPIYKKYVKTQKISNLSKSNFSVFSIELTNKKTKKITLKNLKKNNIRYSVYYKKPMHLEKVFKEYNLKRNNFPISEKLSENILSIPIDPYLKKNEIIKIIKIIKN